MSDSWFKTEILGGLNGADVEFVDPSANDGESGIVAVHLMTPSGLVRLYDSKMARWEKHGTTSNTTLTVLHYFTSCFRHIGSLIYPLKALMEVLEFRVWLNNKFGKVKLFKNKKELLNALIKDSNVEFSKSRERGGGFFMWNLAWPSEKLQGI